MARILLTVICLVLAMGARAETKEQRDARMGWWREAKFGMFIHWGVYSVPAGVWNGTNVDGIGEWIMNHAKIPMADYQKLPAQFDAVKFNADDWVAVAKNAGMKYIVITSKHHDGFAMFHSKVNKFNIYDDTPFHRDPLAELAEACRKAGIRLGFYYSQAQDWNNGGSAINGKWDPAQEHDMDDYIDKTAVPQVREILSNYGPDTPAVLWWDTPEDMNKERAAKLHAVVDELKPNIILNNRLGGGFRGDTETPEQHIPAQGYKDRDWETCMTMNDTWGFKRNDNNWKSSEELIRKLCDIASKGGNFLLNVGPTSEGLIPQPSIDRLRDVGEWMKVNGEAIYGTGPTVFGAEAGKFIPQQGNQRPTFVPAEGWRCTSKPGKLYLLIFKWPHDHKFDLPLLQSRVTRAYLLAAKDQDLTVRQSAEKGVMIELPEKAPDSIASAVCLELADQTARVKQ
jgi:alpha-L-fucosidase